MRQKLEDLVTTLDHKWAFPFRQAVDKWLVPANVFVVSTLASFELGTRLEDQIKYYKPNMEIYYDNLYNTLATMSSFGLTAALELLVAYPLAKFAWNYSRNRDSTYNFKWVSKLKKKTKIKINNFYQSELAEEISRNKIGGKILNFTKTSKDASIALYGLIKSLIRNKYVTLALMGGAGFIAAQEFLENYKGENDLQNTIAYTGAALIAATSALSATNLFNYFRNKKPNVVYGGFNRNKKQLVHSFAALSLAASLTQVDLDLSEEIKAKRDIPSDTRPVQSNSGTINDKFRVAAKYANYYGVNPYLLQAILVTETGVSHYRIRGRKREVQRSSGNAWGIAQLKEIAVVDVNYGIRDRNIRGNKFSWYNVQQNENENIRAAAGFLRVIQNRLGQPETDNDFALHAICYNAGYSEILKIMRREKTKDAWEIVNKIGSRARKNEARDYIQQVMALKEIYDSKLVWPTDSKKIISQYGVKRGSNRRHWGIDISPKNGRMEGDEIRAISDGVVAAAGYRFGKMGYYVKIFHGEPGKGQKRWGAYSYYMHGKAGTIEVKKGEHVRAGEVLMLMGATGNATGSHLHFEVTRIPEDAENSIKHINPKFVLPMREIPLEERIQEMPTVAAYEPAQEDKQKNKQVRYHFKQGNNYLSQNKCGNAIKSYVKALEYAEDSSLVDDLHERIGDCLRNLGRKEQAIAYYEKGLRFQGDRSDSLRNKLKLLKT